MRHIVRRFSLLLDIRHGCRYHNHRIRANGHRGRGSCYSMHRQRQELIEWLQSLSPSLRAQTNSSQSVFRYLSILQRPYQLVPIQLFHRRNQEVGCHLVALSYSLLLQHCQLHHQHSSEHRGQRMQHPCRAERWPLLCHLLHFLHLLLQVDVR